MPRPLVLIFHRPAQSGDGALVRFLADVRGELADRQRRIFERAGARVLVDTEWRPGLSFGELIATLAPRAGGVVVLGSGACVALTRGDAARLVAVAASGGRRALTNNRYSSDICAVADARTLRRVPPLPSDNALPRWLEERAGYEVAEMAGRDRLALDLDTPLDVAIAALALRIGTWLRPVAHDAGVVVPRLAELRSIAADPHAELLVFGRAGSASLRWLERNVRCRVRFLAEERGLRASSPLAVGGEAAAGPRRPAAATLGLLLDDQGPRSLAPLVARLADGAIVDTRVLLAHRYGAGEQRWPSPADRFASDLLRPTEVGDAWLRDLTASAAASRAPILLGSHTLVGPGLRLVLGRSGRASRG